MKIYNIYSDSEEVAIFMRRARTYAPLLMTKSDDAGNCMGVNVGADGVVCYFYTAPDEVTVQVRTNKVIYLF